MDDSDTSAIREARIAKGLSQEELGERVGVKKAAVSKWETGRVYPRPRQARQLAKALGITVDDIYRQQAA